VRHIAVFLHPSGDEKTQHKARHVRVLSFLALAPCDVESFSGTDSMLGPLHLRVRCAARVRASATCTCLPGQSWRRQIAALPALSAGTLLDGSAKPALKCSG